MLIEIKCAFCCGAGWKIPGHINRAIVAGAKLYCSRHCAGMARRLSISVQEKKAAKAEYDLKYRAKMESEELRARKAAYYQRTRDPEKERTKRKARMHLHVEYCRRPEYRAQKSVYDRERIVGHAEGHPLRGHPAGSG
jgi:hypothetical protein